MLIAPLERFQIKKKRLRKWNKHDLPVFSISHRFLALCVSNMAVM